MCNVNSGCKIRYKILIKHKTIATMTVLTQPQVSRWGGDKTEVTDDK